MVGPLHHHVCVRCRFTEPTHDGVSGINRLLQIGSMFLSPTANPPTNTCAVTLVTNCGDHVWLVVTDELGDTTHHLRVMQWCLNVRHHHDALHSQSKVGLCSRTTADMAPLRRVIVSVNSLSSAW